MTGKLSHTKALDTTHFGIDQSDLPPRADGPLDPRQWFDAPGNNFEIEIGTGKGTFLVQEAPLHGDTNYLGIESAAEFYRFAADRMRRRGLNNVRILHTDATEFLQFWCANAVAAVIHLYYSDPWPKKRHHKRRVLRQETVPALHRILVPNGELRLVTDHDELWAWYEHLASRFADLFERREFAPPDSTGGAGEIVGTNYERKFAREGRRVHSMTLRRRCE